MNEWISNCLQACDGIEDPKAAIADFKEAAMVLALILGDLPCNRDWLNPEYEKRANDVVKSIRPFQLLTPAK